MEMYEGSFEQYRSLGLCKLQASWSVFDITDGIETIKLFNQDLPDLIKMLQDYQTYLENKNG